MKCDGFTGVTMQCYGSVCTRCSEDRMMPEIDCSFFSGNTVMIYE